MVGGAGSLEEMNQRIPTKHWQEGSMQTPHGKAAGRLQIQNLELPFCPWCKNYPHPLKYRYNNEKMLHYKKIVLHLNPHLKCSKSTVKYRLTKWVSKVKILVLQKIIQQSCVINYYTVHDIIRLLILMHQCSILLLQPVYVELTLLLYIQLRGLIQWLPR